MWPGFNLEKSKKYAIFAAILIFSILGLLLYGILTSKPKSTTPKELTRQQVILKLPYLTADFTIVYANEKDQIYVNVLKPPYDTNRQKALDWLISQGADPQKLNIFYTPANEFK